MRATKDTKMAGASRTAADNGHAASPDPRHSASVSTEVTQWVARAQTGGISRVPTHVIGRHDERRAYVRARLALPLKMQRIAGQRDSKSHSLHTRDISSSGVFFHYPQRLEPGTPIEFEILLVDRPLGRGSVRMCTMAHVVRAEELGKPGWHGLAATFDDISFVRDDHLPLS